MKITAQNAAPWTFVILSLLVVAGAGAQQHWGSAAYYQLVQEDGPVEWATFWGFTVAGWLFLSNTLQPGPRGFLTWAYGLTMTLGCLLIAMEEISWGQRLFGYRPDELFLADNFQQELNVHNFADTDTRKAVMYLLLGGFGVVYPATGLIRPLRAWLQAQRLTPPAVSVAPGFILVMALYWLYPWQNTGEWVELLAALGLTAGAASQRALQTTSTSRYPAEGPLWLAGALLAGVVTPLALPPQDAAAVMQMARVETEALAEDFRDRRLRSRCGVHKRLYTFVEEYGSNRLHRGAFATLEGNAEDAERRGYFLDPWNLPYWVRHRCSRDRQTGSVLVYSFGPNRRRDSTPENLLEDDIGEYVR